MAKAKFSRWLSGLIASALVAALLPAVQAQRGAKTNGEWPFYGGDLGNTKYLFPLDQINGENFNQLKIAWRWRSADGFLSMTVPGGGGLLGELEIHLRPAHERRS